MYKKILVNDYIQQGRMLLDALGQRTDFPITEAFWYELPEFGEWRLIIATPVVRTVGPIAAYTLVHETLKDLRASLDSSNITLVSPNSPQFRRLREAALGPGRMLRGPASGSVQDVVLQDAYVYKLRKQSPR